MLQQGCLELEGSARHPLRFLVSLLYSCCFGQCRPLIDKLLLLLRALILGSLLYSLLRGGVSLTKGLGYPGPIGVRLAFASNSSQDPKNPKPKPHGFPVRKPTGLDMPKNTSRIDGC